MRSLSGGWVCRDWREDVRVMQHARRRLVAGNWKMHGTLAEARERAHALRSAAVLPCDVLIAAPFVHLPLLVEALAGSMIAVAGQDASEHAAGAYTGEVSAPMLADLGCTHVLVGHSERRALHGEDDVVVAAKCVAALAAGLVPVVCVGETLAERDAGATEAVVLRQLDAVLARLSGEEAGRVLLAYEPVWAIGTGRQATPEQAQEVHALLRARFAAIHPVAAGGLRILYGGSVKAANVAGLFAMPDVDGVLVGGASLDAREFLKICAAAH